MRKDAGRSELVARIADLEGKLCTARGGLEQCRRDRDRARAELARASARASRPHGRGGYVVLALLIVSWGHLGLD